MLKNIKKTLKERVYIPFENTQRWSVFTFTFR